MFSSVGDVRGVQGRRSPTFNAQRLEKIVQKIVRQFLDHTGNRAKKSAIAERVFKLTPEEEATSGTTT